MMTTRTPSPDAVDPTARDLKIAGLTADSRQVRPGYLFAALPGSRADGRTFIAAAIRNGASAILAPEGTRLPADVPAVPVIEDANPRRRFALMAAAFHGRQPETVVAVTGTNGKTSTAQFVRMLWEKMGLRAAGLGTLGLVAPGSARYGVMTTPDPVALHATLAELADGGVDHLAMEASSHGLDQHRLDGVRLAAAGFTNLSRDHLDYHGTMDAYFAAKAMLFDRVMAPGGVAVLNADVPEFDALARIAANRGHRIIGYGTAGADLTVRDLTPLPHGQRLTLDIGGTRHRIDLPLVGRFQCWNALCALGLVLGVGADDQAALDAFSRLDGVRGRLELVARHPGGAPIYVDYAHTPDALENVLTALRPHTAGRLVVVFGCGGDRDRGKRPVMGDIARRLADRVIVTDDNPRGESPAAIRAEILAACPDATEIGDRGEAIRAAVAALEPGDVLVIAGKGHEQGQIIGDMVRDFDDATEAEAAVSKVME